MDRLVVLSKADRMAGTISVNWLNKTNCAAHNSLVVSILIHYKNSKFSKYIGFYQNYKTYKKS